MEIKTVTLIGCGAVGCLYGARLQEVSDLQVVASGKRLERYRTEGLFLNGKKVGFTYVSPEEAKATDLVIIATKNLQLTEAIEEMKNAVGKDTVIMSLLNGIESEGHVAEKYGQEKMLYSYAVGLSSMHDGNHITSTSEGKIVFGEKDNRKTERVEAIASLFRRCGIAYEIPEDIQLSMWKKFMLNTAFNTLSSITWSGYGDFKEPALQTLVRKVSDEVIAVAHAEGITLTKAMVEESIAMITHLEANGMTSMFQDMVAGRNTENEFFCGTVVHLGEKHKIPTPVCETLCLLVKGCERSRQRALKEQVHFS